MFLQHLKFSCRRALRNKRQKFELKHVTDKKAWYLIQFWLIQLCLIILQKSNLELIFILLKMRKSDIVDGFKIRQACDFDILVVTFHPLEIFKQFFSDKESFVWLFLTLFYFLKKYWSVRFSSWKLIFTPRSSRVTPFDCLVVPRIFWRSASKYFSILR